MALLNDLKQKYLQLLNPVKQGLTNATSDDKGWIRQGKFTPGQQVKDYFTPTSNNGNNFWSTPMAGKLASAQQASINLQNMPRVQLPKFQVQNPVGNFLANLPVNIAEGYANIPRNIAVSSTRAADLLGTNIGSALGNQSALTNKQLLNRSVAAVAPMAETLLDVYSPGIGKTLLKQAAKETVKQAATRGILGGAFFGGTGGALMELGKDRENVDYKQAFKSGTTGALVGGLIGGAASGGVAALGQLKKIVAEKVRSLKPNLSETEVIKETGRYVRNELGQFVGQQPVYKKKKDIVFMGDMRESLGLPRYGPPQLGQSVRSLSKEEHLATQADIVKSSVSGEVTEAPGGKYAGSVNLSKLKISPEEKQTIRTVTETARDELQKAKGKVLSNREVVNAAKESQVLQGVVTREQTLQAEAALLKARQQVVSLDKEVTELSKSGNTQLLQKKMGELLESLKTVNANAADRGRQLQALAIEAGDESVRVKLLKDISKVEGDSAKILKEAANVDWGNANKVAEFYRKFIKPSTMEMLDEYRYNNMLSSPRTHIRNAFSNIVQTFVTRPATLAMQGKVGEAAQYYKGAIKSLPDAVSDFAKAFKGEIAIGQQDLKNIPTGKLPTLLTVPSKLLEASDRFFTKLITGGEMATGATTKQAEDVASYSLFRQGLKPQGQGKLLNAIDSVTAWTYNAPKAVRWFVPFIRTPMNFAKQWIEYSPLGVATLPGAGNKKEQLAKTIIGSTVAAIGAKFALDGNTTWSAPTDPKEKEIFYASGRKPFSVKIGDKWVSMMYAGPFAQALAIPAAAKYYQEDNRTALTDSQMDKLGKVATSMAEYLSGQTFLEGINNFVKFFSGDADYTMGKNLGYTAGQIIPMQGLVRWVNSILDPIYRKAATFGEQIQSGIPGMSQKLEPYLTPEGQPSTREAVNAVTPYDISTNQPQYEPALKERQEKLQQNAVVNQAKKDMEKQVSTGGGVKQVGDTVIYTEDGEVKTFKINALPQPPELTGQAEVDKGLKSKYISQLTAYKNDIIKMAELGQIDPAEAETKLQEITSLKTSTSTTKVKATKLKTVKIKVPKIKVPKATKIKIKKPKKLKAYKAPRVRKITLKAAKAPRLKSLRKA